MHAQRGRDEARLARRQVEGAAVRAAVPLVRIEEEEVGPMARLQRAALRDAEYLRRMAGQAPHRLRQREHAELARPVAQEMQAEGGVVEEREVCTRVRQRHERAWI